MGSIGIICSINFEDLLLDRKQRNIGGIGSVIKNVINYLEFDPILLFGVTSNKSQLRKEIKISPQITFVPIIYLPEKSIIPDRVHVFFKSRNIKKILKKYKVGIVYSHCVEMAFWVSKDVFLVEHMHGANNAVSYSRFSYLRLGILIKFWGWLQKKVLQKAGAVITIDEDCYKLASRYKSKEQLHLIRNFIDTNIFYQEVGESSFLKDFRGKKILLFVGRIEEVKGLELFVDTLKELQIREKDWIGVLVGKGTYEETIKNYIGEMDMTNSVFLSGPVYDSNELRKIYNNVTTLLLTSFQEGIPMTILESLACGTPVLSTDVGGIKNLCGDGLPCYVQEGRDPKIFAEKIINIVSKPNSPVSDFPYSTKSLARSINKILKNDKE